MYTCDDTIVTFLPPDAIEPEARAQLENIAGGLVAFTTTFDEVIGGCFWATPTSGPCPGRSFDGIRGHLAPAITAVATILINPGQRPARRRKALTRAQRALNHAPPRMRCGGANWLQKA